MSMTQPRLNVTDVKLETAYIGDSVYISKDLDIPSSLNIFLNNGERDAELLITRKSLIVIDAPFIPGLLRYIQQHQEANK